MCAVSGECAKDKEPIPGGSTRGGDHDNWQMDWLVYRWGPGHASIMLHTANMRLTHPAVALSAAWLNNSISYYLDGRLYHTVHSSAVLLPRAGPLFVANLNNCGVFNQVGAPYANLVDRCAEQLLKSGAQKRLARDRLIECEINPIFVFAQGQGVKAADGIAVFK